MNAKSLVMLGLVVGSTLGGLVPSIWGADMFSLWGIVTTLVGGGIGIWVGFRLSQY